MKGWQVTLLCFLLSILLAVIGWTCTSCYGKLIDVEKSLVELKVELARVQVTMLTREDVKEIVIIELAKQGGKDVHRRTD